MLIPLPNIVNKYKINLKGVFHIGAHLGEEARYYVPLGIKNVVWVEANPKLIQQLKLNVEKFGHKVINTAIGLEDGVELNFHVTNNGQSSSLLELDEHKKEHPQIHVTETIKVVTKTANTIISENNLDLSNYDFLNLDIQGTELDAIKSFGDNIKQFKYVYTEVNKKHLYKNCCLFDELSEYLDKHGFVLKDIRWTKHGWGDALYVKIN